MSDSTAPAAPRAIEYLPLTELRPNPRNPKSHDLETIDDSVGRFGYVEPIIRDDRTGFIVSGHGRTKTLHAMRERGESPPEGILVDEAGHWLVPVGVGWSSRTDTEAAAALIALNRTTELGGWVDESLLELLDELSEAEDGYLGVGFTEEDREALDHLQNVGPRDLDDLATSHGDPTEDDHLVRVVLLLPAPLASRLTEALGSTQAETEEAVKVLLGDG